MLPLMRRLLLRRSRQLGPARMALGASLAMAVLGVSIPAFGNDPTPPPLPDAPPAAEVPHPKPHASTPEVKTELTSVIDAQLAAFRAEDYAKAYTFAAAGIKDMFTQADFEAMVRKSYPVIARSSGADYGMAFDTGEDAVIYVHVQNASTHAEGQFQYLLKRENGVWKIGGVAEVKQEGLSV